MEGAERKKRYIAGAVLLAAVAAAVLVVFSLLSRSDIIELWLTPTAGEDPGWRWEVLADGQVSEAQAVFPDQYTFHLSADAADAVRGRLVLPAFRPYASMRITASGCGVELFLDGEELYSDFRSTARGADGFLTLTPEQRAALAGNDRRVIVSLPDEYAGRELTMNFYYPQPQADPMPICPTLCSEETFYAVIVTSAVPSLLLAILWALLALLLAAVFVMDSPGGARHWRSLLILLYFLMLFLHTANQSAAGTVSLLDHYQYLTVWAALYAVPLQLYLALLLHGWKRWFLCAATALWVVSEARQFLAAMGADLTLVHLAHNGRYAFWLMLLYAAVLLIDALQHRHRPPGEGHRNALALWLIVAVVRVLYGSLEFDSDLPQYLRELADAFMPDGNCLPMLSAVMDITAITATILLVSGVVRRVVGARRTVDILRERGRQMLAGYERVLQAEEATNAANHEMRHHMTALAGLLQQDDPRRAREYVAAVTDALDRLPATRYSPNILVNAIVGTYLDEAKREGIRVEYSLNVPGELAIADEDLSVFLTNLLENALHACRQIHPGGERFIRLKMVLHENFLFIGCVNAAPDEQETEVLNAEQRAARRHGYGLAAMRQIAEKYSSMLLVERGAGTFSVKSNFSLKAAVKA